MEWGYGILGMRLWDPWNEIVRAWDRTSEIFPLQTYNLRDPSSVLKVVRNSNVVINLVGRDYETRSEPPLSSLFLIETSFSITATLYQLLVLLQEL